MEDAAADIMGRWTASSHAKKFCAMGQQRLRPWQYQAFVRDAVLELFGAGDWPPGSAVARCRADATRKHGARAALADAAFAAADAVTGSFAARHTKFPASLHWCKLTSPPRCEATVRAAVAGFLQRLLADEPKAPAVAVTAGTKARPAGPPTARPRAPAAQRAAQKTIQKPRTAKARATSTTKATKKRAAT